MKEKNFQKDPFTVQVQAFFFIFNRIYKIYEAPDFF